MITLVMGSDEPARELPQIRALLDRESFAHGIIAVLRFTILLINEVVVLDFPGLKDQDFEEFVVSFCVD